MARMPRYAHDLKLAAFKAWIVSRGAELLQETNEYEVLRFRSGGSVGIIYRNGAGLLNFQGEAGRAYASFRNGQQWSAGIEKVKSRKKPIVVRSLLRRDGNECFYCGNPMPDGEESLEHLLPRAHGGSTHISNLTLAHGACNKEAGHLSVVEKVKLREKMRAPAAESPAIRESGT